MRKLIPSKLLQVSIKNTANGKSITATVADTCKLFYLSAGAMLQGRNAPLRPFLALLASSGILAPCAVLFCRLLTSVCTVQALHVKQVTLTSQKALSSRSATSAAASCRLNGPSSNPAGSDGALALPDPSENLRTRTVTFTTNRTRLDYIPCPMKPLSLTHSLSGPSFISIPFQTLIAHSAFIPSISPPPLCCFSSHSLDTIPQNRTVLVSFFFSFCNASALMAAAPASPSCLLSRA